jgi:flagellar protein FliO/FliZ
MIPNTTSMLTGIVALAAVLALVLLAGRIARLGGWVPRAGGVSARRLRLEETLSLDSRRRLQLVSCDGRSLLVMTGGTNDVVIGWAPHAGDLA